MARKPRASLGFDTSKKGGGALIREAEGSALPVAECSAAIPFEEREQEAVLTRLFTAAKALREQGYAVACFAEQAQGYDPRAQSIRAGVNQRIGVLKHYANLFEIPWGGEVAPNSAKLALTGSGNANKAMVQRFVVAIFHERPADDNEADAFAVALAGLHGRVIVRNTGGRTHKRTLEAKVRPQGRLF